LACLHLLPANGKNLQEGECLLRLLIGVDIDQHGARFAILSDDDGFALLSDPVKKFGSVRLDVADGLIWVE